MYHWYSILSLRACAIDSHVSVPLRGCAEYVRTKTYVMLFFYVTRMKMMFLIRNARCWINHLNRHEITQTPQANFLHHARFAASQPSNSLLVAYPWRNGIPALVTGGRRLRFLRTACRITSLSRLCFATLSDKVCFCFLGRMQIASPQRPPQEGLTVLYFFFYSYEIVLQIAHISSPRYHLREGSNLVLK